MLGELWATAACDLGNRTTPLHATHRPFWSGNLITNLCDFLPEVGREGLPLPPGPSAPTDSSVPDHPHVGPLPYISIDLGETLKLSLGCAVGSFVPDLVLILSHLADGPSQPWSCSCHSEPIWWPLVSWLSLVLLWYLLCSPCLSAMGLCSHIQDTVPTCLAATLGSQVVAPWAETAEDSNLAVEVEEGSSELGSHQLGTSTFLLLSSYFEITLNSWQKVTGRNKA